MRAIGKVARTSLKPLAKLRLAHTLGFLVRKPFKYQATNESLHAIVEGLDLQPGDRALAIAGSGDQAFAMLEYVDQVTVVDISQDQLDLVKQRANVLKRGYEDLFLMANRAHSFSNDIQYREDYFRVPGRLSRIANKLDRLRFTEAGDIIGAVRQYPPGMFNKFYMSNADSKICNPDLTRSSEANLLKHIAVFMPIIGLIYLDYSNPPVEISTDKEVLLLRQDLAKKAQERGKERRDKYPGSLFWHPQIYERVA